MKKRIPLRLSRAGAGTLDQESVTKLIKAILSVGKKWRRTFRIFNQCEFCPRSFRTATGLGVHQQKAHRMQYDQKVQVARGGEIKSRWTKEEIYLLASKEVELGEQRFMNLALAPHFPQRSAEAVKCRRKNPEYRRLVEEIRARPMVVPQNMVAQQQPNPGDQRVEACEGRRLRPRVVRPPQEVINEEEELEQQVIPRDQRGDAQGAQIGEDDIRVRLRPRRGLPPYNELEEEGLPHLQGQRLLPDLVARERQAEVIGAQMENRADGNQLQARRIEDINIIEDNVSIEFEDLLELMNRLGMVNGEPRPVPERRPQRVEGLERISRAVRKRREYAKTQELYYKDKAAALKFITNRAAFVDYVAPTRDIRLNWENYFSVNDRLPRVDDGEILQRAQRIEQFRDLDAVITGFSNHLTNLAAINRHSSYCSSLSAGGCCTDVQRGPRTPNSRPSSARQADSETQLGSPCTASPRPLLLASPSEEDSQPRVRCVERKGVCGQKGALVSASALRLRSLRKQPLYETSFLAASCLLADAARTCREGPELRTLDQALQGRRTARRNLALLVLRLHVLSYSQVPPRRILRREFVVSSVKALSAGGCCTDVQRGPRTPNSRPSSARQADSETQLGSPCTASPRPLLLASPSEEDSQTRVRCVERKGVCGQKGALVSASAPRLRSLRKQPLYETSFLAACLLADAARTCREGPRTPNSRPSSASKADSGTQLGSSSTASPPHNFLGNRYRGKSCPNR
ncbi:Retrovirus-related Pol polyprotein from type-2 retrotransposable element R2DM [Armadillidium vulgare]|nr:Retrovirus-related Pol polyprotein from type-2 retrotransposable element R2DM [Armadillidium vulgare]